MVLYKTKKEKLNAENLSIHATTSKLLHEIGSLKLSDEAGGAAETNVMVAKKVFLPKRRLICYLTCFLHG